MSLISIATVDRRTDRLRSVRRASRQAARRELRHWLRLLRDVPAPGDRTYARAVRRVEASETTQLRHEATARGAGERLAVLREVRGILRRTEDPEARRRAGELERRAASLIIARARRRCEICRESYREALRRYLLGREVLDILRRDHVAIRSWDWTERYDAPWQRRRMTWPVRQELADATDALQGIDSALDLGVRHKAEDTHEAERTLEELVAPALSRRPVPGDFTMPLDPEQEAELREILREIRVLARG